MFVLCENINVYSNNYLFDLKQNLNKNNGERNTSQTLQCIIELELLKGEEEKI